MSDAKLTDEVLLSYEASAKELAASTGHLTLPTSAVLALVDEVREARARLATTPDEVTRATEVMRGALRCAAHDPACGTCAALALLHDTAALVPSLRAAVGTANDAAAQAVTERDAAEANHEALLRRLEKPFGPDFAPPVFICKGNEDGTEYVGQVSLENFDVEARASTAGEATVLALALLAREVVARAELAEHNLTTVTRREEATLRALTEAGVPTDAPISPGVTSSFPGDRVRWLANQRDSARFLGAQLATKLRDVTKALGDDGSETPVALAAKVRNARDALTDRVAELESTQRLLDTQSARARNQAESRGSELGEVKRRLEQAEARATAAEAKAKTLEERVRELHGAFIMSGPDAPPTPAPERCEGMMHVYAKGAAECQCGKGKRPAPPTPGR